MQDISNVAGTTFGLIGMGIGLSFLARTTRDISRSNKVSSSFSSRRKPVNIKANFRPKKLSRNHWRMSL